MKKHIRYIVLVLLVFNPLFSQAQYFDWVQTYTGSDISGTGETNIIRQSVSGSNGNLYFIGACAFDASIDGNRLLPMSPYGNQCVTSCTIFGKFTQNGELEWSKIIHSNHGAHHRGGNIQLLGDSLLFLCAPVWVPYTFPLEWPMAGRNYLYYMDTLMRFFYKGDSIVHNGNYLYDYSRFKMYIPVTSYTTMDKLGNIRDEYWLFVTYLDTNGTPFNLSVFNGEEARNISQANGLLREGLSCVDNEGNIIVVRSLSDYFFKYDSLSERSVYCYINDADLSTLRIYVNGKRYFDVPLPDVRPSAGRHNYQILKFSPHFEELLASQFLFEPTPEHLDTICESEINELKCDKDNNLYLVVSSNYLLTETGESNRLKIGGSDSLWLRFLEYDHNKGFLVKYDSALNPVYLRYFERDSTLELNGPGGLASGLRASHFDEEGNLVFVGGTTTSDSLITSCYFGGNEVELNKMFVRINPEDGSGVTFGDRMHSEMVAIGSNDIVDVVAKNNRIIQQVKYRWWLDFAGERYEKAEAYEWGMGFAVWDYDGNELCFVDYGINGSLNNGIRSICLVDSVLYLTGMLASGGAQFGDVTVYNSGSSQSFIARYVDTAFMHPYVRPGGQQDIQLVVRDGEPVVTVYPNPCAQRVTVDWNGDEPPLAATVTDITGRTYSVALTAAGAGQYDSEAKIAGRYTIDFSSLPAANYLLTITTPSGHSVTTRLLKR